jgi:hypothetical protein
VTAPTIEPGVRVLRLLAPLGSVALAVPVASAVVAGAPLGAEGGAILALAWGLVTMVDLGIALVLGWAWIAWREARPLAAIAWLPIVALTGSAGVCAYLAIAARRAGTVREVLVGPRRVA